MRDAVEPKAGGAVVPSGSLLDRLVMLGEPNGATAEAYRELRTNLRFAPDVAMVARGGRVYLLADGGGVGDHSAVAGNLGVACAMAGERVIIVDADLRGTPNAGSLSALFGHANATEGIATAVLGPDEDHKVLLPLVETGVPNLLLLPAGGRGTNPADLLGADSFGALLAALRAQADVVLIDAPPVADVADSRAIAARVDGVLLLVAQGKTRRPQAQRALAALEQVGATVLGVVMTET
ncbi:MAG: CpsD/CapB family tyrosine-protein kinase [Thermomicrobiales bacterium]